ncbi:hypothetical protein Leryth_025276 [Lithospermum erythrorhizon]|nr:hypothetical protein Leryth_025276 [Lithospermum erythrorhizon]
MKIVVISHGTVYFCISWTSLKIISTIPNVQHLRSLKKEELDEMPLVTEVLGDLDHEPVQVKQTANHDGQGEESRIVYASRTRVIIHGHHPDDKQGKDGGKLIHLPDSIENLLDLAEKKFGARGSKIIMMADSSRVEDLGALRENDHLYIV